MGEERNPRSSNAVDKHVGERLRLRRKAINLSQQALAGRLGVTFQQVQKYERGVNRMGAGRLFSLADALGVPISYFFEGLGSSPVPASQAEPDVLSDFLRTHEGVQLASAVVRIRDPEVRRRLVQLADTLGEETDASD